MEERFAHRCRHFPPRRHSANPSRQRDGQDCRRGSFPLPRNPHRRLRHRPRRPDRVCGKHGRRRRRRLLRPGAGGRCRAPSRPVPLAPRVQLIFLPWQLRQQYRADPATVLIAKEVADYFDEAWYAVTQKKIGPDSMLKEYPSDPEEAFEVSIEGAYFKTQMIKAREERRMGKVPVDPSRPVNTFWDIGKSDKDRKSVVYGKSVDLGGR